LGLGEGLLFSSEGGGQTTAVLSIFTITCKRLHIAPFGYLRDVFQRISAHPVNRLDDLLPDNWKAAQRPIPNLPRLIPIAKISASFYMWLPDGYSGWSRRVSRRAEKRSRIASTQ
jgi:hypothetical protein